MEITKEQEAVYEAICMAESLDRGLAIHLGEGVYDGRKIFDELRKLGLWR